MKKIALFTLAALSAAFSSCSLDDELTTAAEPYEIYVNVGNETKVDAAFGDSEYNIKFTWSEGDILRVTLFEDDAVFTSSSANELKYYEFVLKEGAGTNSGKFVCDEFNPSDVFKSGKTYTIKASYNAYKVNGYYYDLAWDKILTHCYVPLSMTLDPSKPLSNVSKFDVLVGDITNVTASTKPKFNLAHGIGVFKIVIKNNGQNPISISSLSYPAAADENFAEEGNRYFGEHDCIVKCTTPVVIAAGQSYAFYQPIHAMNWGPGEKHEFMIKTSDNRSFKVEKSAPDPFFFERGVITRTTINVNMDNVAEGDIPDINGGDDDDF